MSPLKMDQSTVDHATRSGTPMEPVTRAEDGFVNRILIRKYVGQSMPLFMACGLALFAFAWVRVWVVSLLDMGQFQTILEQFRDFEKFAPIGFDALFTYPGRVGMTYDEPIVMLCTVIWCIARGSDVISGEMGRGTLEMLLAQPIRRRTLVLSHATVSVVGLLLLCLLVWAGIGVGIMATSVEESVAPPSFRIPIFNIDVPLTVDQPETQTVPLSERVDPAMFAASTFHLFAFGFFLLGLATLFSSLDRYRWRTVGAIVGVYVIQLVMFGLGKAAESLQWMLSLSFFSCYKPQKMTEIVAKEGLAGPWSLIKTAPDVALPPLVYPLILIGLGTVFYGGRHRSFPAAGFASAPVGDPLAESKIAFAPGPRRYRGVTHWTPILRTPVQCRRPGGPGALMPWG